MGGAAEDAVFAALWAATCPCGALRGPDGRCPAGCGPGPAVNLAGLDGLDLGDEEAVAASTPRVRSMPSTGRSGSSISTTWWPMAASSSRIPCT